MKRTDTNESTQRSNCEVALRVLREWNGKRFPDPSDVAALRKAFPCEAHLPVDELACHVVDEFTHSLSLRAKRDSAIRTGVKGIVLVLAASAAG